MLHVLSGNERDEMLQCHGMYRMLPPGEATEGQEHMLPVLQQSEIIGLSPGLYGRWGRGTEGGRGTACHRGYDQEQGYGAPWRVSSLSHDAGGGRIVSVVIVRLVLGQLQPSTHVECRIVEQ